MDRHILQVREQPEDCIHIIGDMPDEVSETLINAIFGQKPVFEDPNGSDGVDDDPFVTYQGPDDPEIRYR